MKTELDQTTLQRAIDVFGADSQVYMAIEECSELVDALMKYRRGRIGVNDVVTEIADVQIMCAQLEIIFGGSSKIVEMERAKKMDRLRGRIEKHDMGDKK